MYSVLIVEDDFVQRDILKKMIVPIYNSAIIYEADSESTALDILTNKDINMFLIDIYLKNSSGLDLAMKIRNIPKYEFRQIIFLTTHMEYITQAFKQSHCYDYVLKPYNKNDVQAMLNKIISSETNKLSNIIENQREDKEVVIALKNGIYVGIKIKDILFIEVRGKNCEINTISGVYIASNISLKKLLQLVECDNIIQSHRAFAINKDYICKIEKLDTKLSVVYFANCTKTALLGYKFKNDVMFEFRKGKVILC